MNIKEIMNRGELYIDYGEGREELEEERKRCQSHLYEYNQSHPNQIQQRTQILKSLFACVGDACWIEPPFKCAYGNRMHIGNHFYANFNLVVVDDVDVYIGNHVMIAPNVTITTTGHPIDPIQRRDGSQFSKSVMIEDDVWIGANVVILPGVTIKKGAVIGAGSVVTKDIPEYVVAYGVPCKVVKGIE